jgi:hypothetical protein
MESNNIYFGAEAPTNGTKNWIRTVPGKGYFVILRLYGPEQEFFDKAWVPDDVKKIQ